MVANLHLCHVAFILIKLPSGLLNYVSSLYLLKLRIGTNVKFHKLDELIPKKDSSQNLFNYQAKSKMKLDLERCHIVDMDDAASMFAKADHQKHYWKTLKTRHKSSTHQTNDPL